MRGEMKTVTFTLVCAPGQEGPLRKVTLPALSLSIPLCVSAQRFPHVGEMGLFFITKTAHCHTHTLTD